MDRGEKPPRRRLGCAGVLVLILSGLLLLMLGGCTTIVLQNDAAARSVADRLSALPLPPGAQRVAVASKAGKLVGNGNGIQYVGAMLIRSAAEPATVVSFYEGQPEVGSDIAVTRSVELGASDSAVVGDLVGASGRSDEYVVYAWGSPPSWFHADVDLRGH